MKFFYQLKATLQKPDEFFLNINERVHLWISHLKNEGNETVPVKVDDFLIMNEQLMKKFEKFCEQLPSTNQTLIPSHDAIKYLLRKHGCAVIEVERYGSKYLSLTSSPACESIVDDLCEWIIQTREEIQSGQFKCNPV